MSRYHRHLARTRAIQRRRRERRLRRRELVDRWEADLAELLAGRAALRLGRALEPVSVALGETADALRGLADVVECAGSGMIVGVDHGSEAGVAVTAIVYRRKDGKIVHLGEADWIDTVRRAAWPEGAGGA